MQQNHFTAANMKDHTCNSPIGYTTADLPKVSIPFYGATNRHTDGPTVFYCSDIPADNSTIILVQVFEPLPNWFSTRSGFEEPGWENFQRVIHTHVVPYMVQHVKLNALHECNDRAVRLCCENGNHTIGKAEAKNDCQCSDQLDGQPHVGREPERKQRTRTTMPLTGRDLLDPMRLHGKHLLTILASHFHRVLNRTDLAHRYLLCCQDRHFPLHQNWARGVYLRDLH